MSKKLIIIIAVVVILAGGGGFAASKFLAPEPEMGAAIEVEPEPPETYYVTMGKEFVVNFRQPSATQFLMVDVTVASIDEKVPEILETHMPELRNELLMLFSDRATKELFGDAGKSALRASAVERVNEVLTKHYEDGTITDLFFTRFVMQ